MLSRAVNYATAWAYVVRSSVCLLRSGMIFTLVGNLEYFFSSSVLQQISSIKYKFTAE